MIEWITSNWITISACGAGLYAFLLALVKLTPTPKDDVLLAKVYNLVKMIVPGKK